MDESSTSVAKQANCIHLTHESKIYVSSKTDSGHSSDYNDTQTDDSPKDLTPRPVSNNADG